MVLLPKLHLSQSWPRLSATLGSMGLPLMGNYSVIPTLGDAAVA